MKPVFLGVEDELSDAVARKMIGSILGDETEINSIGKRDGFGSLRKNIDKFRTLAARQMVMILTDLDRVECAPSLRRAWRVEVPLPERMSFRVAVREVEAWIMADRGNFARFLGVSEARLSDDVEGIADPKAALFELVKISKKRDLKGDILPSKGAVSSQGLGYNARLGQFVREDWDVVAASANSNSLERAMKDLRRLSEILN